MVENFFSFLSNIGYSHPLHPMFTHLPMGMIIGMVVFSFLGLIWKNRNFDQTAYYCSIFALVALPVVAAAGILDWIHFQQEEWNVYIMAKMILASVLTIFLIFSIVLKKKYVTRGKILLVYFLCLACAGGLGYAGGTLVYG